MLNILKGEQLSPVCSQFCWQWGLVHRPLRDAPRTEGGRSISRKPTYHDIQLFQQALAATVQSLSCEPGFRSVFGGQNHTVEQLRLASHGEVFCLPWAEADRTTFFKTLNKEVLTAFGWSTASLPQPLMVVFKGINQKVCPCAVLSVGNCFVLVVNQCSHALLLSWLGYSSPSWYPLCL